MRPGLEAPPGGLAASPSAHRSPAQVRRRQRLLALAALAVGAGLLLASSVRAAAPTPLPGQKGGVTNRLPLTARPGIRTNAVTPSRPGTAVTNVAAGKAAATSAPAVKSSGTNAPSRFTATLRRLQSVPVVYYAAGGFALLLVAAL